MINRWLNIRESAVSLLRIFALLVVLFLLSRIVVGVLRDIDNYDTWYYTPYYVLHGLTGAIYYGGIVFALSWIVYLIGNRDEENARRGWLNSSESAVSLLKILAFSILLLCLPIILIGRYIVIDNDGEWYRQLMYLLAPIVDAVYYGGTIFALSWIVYLMSNRNKGNIRSGWLNDKESAISLLRIFALLIILLSIPLAVIQKFLWSSSLIDWPWEYTVDNILYVLYTAAYQGGIVFALAWIVSLLGQRDGDEVPDEIPDENAA